MLLRFELQLTLALPAIFDINNKTQTFPVRCTELSRSIVRNGGFDSRNYRTPTRTQHDVPAYRIRTRTCISVLRNTMNVNARNGSKVVYLVSHLLMLCWSTVKDGT